MLLQTLCVPRAVAQFPAKKIKSANDIYSIACPSQIFLKSKKVELWQNKWANLVCINHWVCI